MDNYKSIIVGCFSAALCDGKTKRFTVSSAGGVMGSVIANEWVVESVQEFKSDTRRLPLKSNKMINVL